MSVHPADVLATPPKIAYGTKRLRSAYTGNALTARNASSGAFANIGFSDDVLDAAALDAIIAGTTGQVTQVFDQMGGGFNIGQAIGEAPKIGTLELGGARSVIFEGGSQSGALFSLNFPVLTSLGLSAKDYSIYAVMQPSSSMYRNQNFTPGVGIGTILSLESASGSVVQVLANGGTDVFNGPGRGTISVRDNAAFDFVPTDWMVEAAPIVLAVTSNAMGVGVFQNETYRRVANRSVITDPIVTGYLGKRGTSVAGPQSESGDFMLTALMVYAEGHSPRERAVVSASLYQKFAIEFSRSRYNANNVICIGDSIPAGYVTLGIYGMMARLQAMMPSVRFGNFCVPGAQTTFDVGTPAYAYMEGGFPGTVLPQLTYSRRKNVLLMMGPGNDYARAVPANPATVYAARVSMTQQAIAEWARVGVSGRVFICTLPPRNVAYQTQIAAENALIRAGAVANGYEVIEVANDAQMSVIPGPMYFDSGHPSTAGQARCAQIMYPQVSAYLAS